MLGSWLGHQRKHYKRGRLSGEKVLKMEAIGFTWSIFDEQFEQGFQETLRYKEKVGTINAPLRFKAANGSQLGRWQASRRQAYKKGLLAANKIQRLEEIGFIWDHLDDAFEQGFRDTLEYMKQYGTPNAPRNYESSAGLKLGSWQHVIRRFYAKGKLSRERVRRLEEIGFAWNRFDKSFDIGFQETLKHKAQFGIPNARNSYITENGFRLGAWQQNKKQQHKKGKLPQNQIKLLEGIGFTWDVAAEAFEEGFNETLKFRKQFGKADAPQKYITEDGFKLGMWQSYQRGSFIKGTLSPDKIRRLEEIGFPWDSRDKTFEDGITETLKYKQEFGTPNAPLRYQTVAGFKLGIWQSHKKQAFKKGKLSPDKVKRLEDMGFKWNCRNQSDD
ncbi:MAG: helicase associated domain-containing protein [Deltaproteobacteria bacterium]|nr:helicase associated domain-containing protein [Deltaproteobacteria bacterium]